MDLRMYPKNKKFVIQDMDDGRKQIGKPYPSRSAAKAALKKLIGDVATDKVILSDRHKFKEEFKKYAEKRLASAEDPTVRLSVEGVSAYLGYYRNYIVDCFPDIYLDEVRGKTLHDFVVRCYDKKKATYKTVKNIISRIKTFLRDCLGEGLITRCSVLHWKMSKQYDLQPVDDDLYYSTETTPIMPDEAKKLMDNLWNNRNKDFYSAYKLAAIGCLSFTGLRFSELKGIKKDVINLNNRSIFIAGVFNHREGLWKNKTKTQASKRDIEIIDELMIVLKFWLDVIKDMRNPYLFPATRGPGPISEFRFRKLIWKTYEENGLAKLEWTRKDHKDKHSRGRSETFRVIESPFKGCPTKNFRHSLATHLVNAVKSDPALDTNYVRSVLGHGSFKTTSEIYGKHIMRVTPEERVARRAAVSKASKATKLIQK